ncbi:polysaccharide biosynthesis/export family protein [Temperatibacter marinus]|uniref:Polysaccharide biosynthesis/export family protein n=1 Tax=Temperatibacter marinus TaxID=1456591 RepID=A0AA52H9Q9_9PROT|nr:polysaccharide biosynthesis/export family protein [Temperatibacter marinus]WND03174.1 polysaccharide biosynthesis/export family protein [Temperatibacter marinus]
MGKMSFSLKLIMMIGLAQLCGVMAQSVSAQAGFSQEDIKQFQAAQKKKKPKLKASLGSSEPEPIETTKALETGQNVFGHRLFNGAFSEQKFIGFNPDYTLSAGDSIILQMWGGFESQLNLTVDAQGNIFLPKIGPILVRGIKNKDLNAYITKAAAKTFKSNVGIYASLMAAEPVKIFVTGFVNKPGLYSGHSADSVLRFLDLAGGIDARRGSYIDIQLVRNGETKQVINLYDFILQGRMPQFQMFDGDTLLVKPLKGQIGVRGLAQNPYIYEFNRDKVKVADVLAYARPTSKATHVKINRNNREKEEVEYFALDELGSVSVSKGDVLELTSDKLPGTISIRVEGEHLSSQEHILPYGATLSDLMRKIKFGPHAVPGAIQLYRESNKVRQKERLMSQLRALESSVLTARSGTVEEAALRNQEAAMILQWVSRAKEIEMKGQVVLGKNADQQRILLEANDKIVIPAVSNLVHVNGDVMFPTSMAFNGERTPLDYINLAGGFVQKSGNSIVLILHQDGTFEKIAKVDSRKTDVLAGDEIIILPKVQTKYLQATKDITQVLYQIAVSAGVLLRI